MSEKLERLLNLTAALLETQRPIPAKEIRSRVTGYPEGDEAFKRAFERDKDDLREMGIPLRVEVITGTYPELEGYRIHKSDYYLRDPGLEPDELAALHLAANAVRLEGIGLGSALAKLGGTDDDAGSASGLPRIEQLPASPALVDLFDAVSTRRRAAFSYGGTRREFDPYRLDFTRGRWYVSGYDHVRAAERVFRLDRIEGEVDLGPGGAFERPETEVPGIRRQPWELGGDERFRARLLIDAHQAAVARLAAGEAAVSETRDDGSVVLELDVVNVDAFRSFVLGFLEHAEVLAPDELRHDIVAWLEAMR